VKKREDKQNFCRSPFSAELFSLPSLGLADDVTTGSDDVTALAGDVNGADFSSNAEWPLFLPTSVNG
jgi:hypothetical protein